MRQTLLSLITPSLVTLATLVALLIIAMHQPAILPKSFDLLWFKYLPCLLLVASGVFAWRFNYTKLMFVNLFCTFLFVITTYTSASSPAEEQAYTNGALLVTSLCFLLFHFLNERGVINIHGLLRGTAIIAFALLLLPFLTDHFSLSSLDALGILTHPDVLRGPFSPLTALVVLTTLVLLTLITRNKDTLSGKFFAIHLFNISLGFFLSAVLPDSISAAWSDTETLAAKSSILTFCFTSSGLCASYAVVEFAYRHAFVDELTKLPTRSALDYALAALGKNYTIAMVDIDNFKKINDKYGHTTGDQALRFIASRLSDVHKGKIYRYGGEEFVIIFPRLNRKESLSLLDDLRHNISKTPFYIRGKSRPKQDKDKVREAQKQRGQQNQPSKTIRLTISIGIASTPLDKHNETPQQILDAADKALYKAKQQGRNRVIYGQ